MHPAEIQAALKLRGYSQAGIAKTCGVQPSAVSMVINGRGRSRPIEEKLSEVLKLPLGRLWPLWYDDSNYAGGVQDGPALADDEIQLVQRYRALSASQKAQALAMLDVLARDGRSSTGHHVTADRGSVAAGGDVTLGQGSGRRKK